MIRITHTDEETLRAKFTELRSALDDIQKYMGRKTAKIISLTIEIEKVLDIAENSDEKKPSEK